MISSLSRLVVGIIRNVQLVLLVSVLTVIMRTTKILISNKVHPVTLPL